MSRFLSFRALSLNALDVGFIQNSSLKNRLYAKARKEQQLRSFTITNYISIRDEHAGGSCDLAVLSLKQMANKKFILSSATKQKLDRLKAQWVNETCRDLQAKVIKTAAFCHNRALQDLIPYF
jgi:hypothetical protein